MPSAFNIYVLPDTCANNIQQRYEALDRVIAETHKSVHDRKQRQLERTYYNA